MFRNFFRKKIKALNSRRFKRFRADFLVKYQLDRKGEAHITNVRDVSAGGLRFLTDRPVPESSLLNVSIYIPPLGRIVEAVAQVLRVRKAKGGILFNVAVNFLDLRREDREAINQFAETLSDDQRTRFLIDHANIVIRSQPS